MTVGYEVPEVRDYGDLLDITAAAGSLGTEDGAGKTVSVDGGSLGSVTVQLFP